MPVSHLSAAPSDLGSLRLLSAVVLDFKSGGAWWGKRLIGEAVVLSLMEKGENFYAHPVRSSVQSSAPPPKAPAVFPVIVWTLKFSMQDCPSVKTYSAVFYVVHMV